MAYMHIDNLYKTQDILLFRECYALEKIHGTSAHVSWEPEAKKLSFFSGGTKHDTFLSLFDQEGLLAAFTERLDSPTVFYGEAYGGKEQGMRATYGESMKFVVFDVKMENCWLNVEAANEVALACGLEFVSFNKISTDLDRIDAERDAPSIQAIRNGIEEDKLREGVVLRPLIEVVKNNGKRIIAKHKREEFRERKSIPKVDPVKREIMEKAEAIAAEWVTPVRMDHVLGKMARPLDMRNTGDVIKAMVEDVCREADGLIADNKVVRRAIGASAARLYKKRVTEIKPVDNVDYIRETESMAAE